MLIDVLHCNSKTIRLKSGGRVTLDCSNLFAMPETERSFVLALLGDLENWERRVEAGDVQPV